MTQLAPFINIPGKLVKYYKQINIWAEEDAGKMSNIDFPSKQHIKPFLKIVLTRDIFTKAISFGSVVLFQEHAHCPIL